MSRIRISVVLVLVLAASLVMAPWAGHVDDGDAALYQVVARHMVVDGTWFDLRYLPQIHPQFREHLPFGLWPMAAAIRVVGEGAVPVLGLFWTLGAIAVAGWTARRLFGPAAGVFAMGVLALTESMVVLGGRGRLDPPVVFLGALAAAPVLWGASGARAIFWSGGFGALAALVKGPFGILPVAAAWVSRLVFARGARGRVFVAAACVAGVCLAPLALFLGWDRLGGSGTWWTGYVEHQLLASAMGARDDGQLAWWFPFRTLLGRFWPGLAFAFAGGVLSLLPKRLLQAKGLEPEQIDRLRLVALNALLIVLALCVPARKLWNHALVAYPVLAVLGAGAFSSLLAWWRPPARVGTWAVRSLGALTVIVVIAASAGLGRHLLSRPCVEGAIARGLESVPPQSPLAVVASKPQWPLIAVLAAERRLDGYPIPALDHASLELLDRTGWALVVDDAMLPEAQWELRAEEGRVRLYARRR